MDCKIDFSTVTTDKDRVAVIATAPLTKDETWIEFEKGELLMFDKGNPYVDHSHCETIEKQGRGLSRNKSGMNLNMLGKDSIMIPNSLKLNKSIIGRDFSLFLEEEINV